MARNTPAGSRFDYLDTLGSAGGSFAPFGGSPNEIPNGLNDLPGGSPGNEGQRPALPQRFFRAVMQEHFFDALGLSMERVGAAAAAPYRTRLMVSNAQPAHTLVLSASDDLRHWTPLATNTPAAVTNWLFLDTNAPVFEKRFYRAVGRGK